MACENCMVIYDSYQCLLWKGLLMITNICSFLFFLGTLLDYISQPLLFREV